MTLQLRPYQNEAIAAVKREWEKVNATMLVAATGLGKTHIGLSLINEVLQPRQRALWLVHRRELVSQPMARVAKDYPGLAPRAGIVMAGENQVSKEFIIATVQTLASEKRLRQVLAHGKFDFLMTDECFPAGTLVDGRPIETIRVGDLITAWNEETKGFTPRRVTHVFKNPAPSRLLRFTCEGLSLTCTPNHPILCNGQWKPARDIQVGDHLSHVQNTPQIMRCLRYGVHAAQLEFSQHPHMLGRMQSQTPGSPSKSRSYALSTMRQNSRVQGAFRLGNGTQGAGLLLGRMQNSLRETHTVRNGQRDQSQVCQRPHENQQSDDQPAHQSQNAKEAQGTGLGHGRAWGQWQTDHSTNQTSRRVGLGNGSRYSDGQSQGKRIPIILQSGHWQSCPKNRRRSRWADTQTSSPTRGRSQENCLPRSVRVDGIEILERGSDRRFEHLCPDDYVYNLEVEHDHTYLANGIIVHNCHHATARAYTDLYATLQQVNPNMKHLGVTATPVRADGDGLARTYQSVAAKYDIGWGIQHGFLSPVRWFAIQTGISLKGIRSQAGDFSARQLADVFETGNCFDLVVHTHQQYGTDRPFLAYTVSVEGAHALAAKFNGAGIPVGSADANTPDEERKQLIRKLERGELRGLVNMGLWTEGLDIPQVSLIHQVRPTQSDGLYVQIIGRALRTYPGKTDALILDYAPKDARNIAMFGDILGVPLDKKHYIKPEQEAEEEEEGEVQSGFTFDGDEYRFLNGNPMEIVARELHYLELSPWSWNRTPDGYMTLGLGEAADQIKRTLVIRPPQNGHDQYTLYLAAQRPEEPHLRAYHVQTGDFETLHAWGEQYANQRGNATLAAKQRTWRNEPPSPGQINFAKRLGIFKPGLSKGDLANLITMHLAVAAVERI